MAILFRLPYLKPSRVWALAALAMVGLPGLLAAPAPAASGPPTLTLARPEDQARFRVSTFASGLSYPTSLVPLADGSLLVGTSVGPSLFTSPSGSLLRLVDLDGDGSADGPALPLATGLPGLVSSVRRVDRLVMALSSVTGKETISLLRTGASATDPLTPVGALRFHFPPGFFHTTYALAARRSPADPAAIELFFNIGAKSNASATSESVGLEGQGGVSLPLQQLAADAIHRLTLVADAAGTGFLASLQPIATGLRNAAGLVFAANGDLYLQDNGIDSPANPDVSLSADELNRIAAADIGRNIPDFGFPHTYVSSASGETISGGLAVCPSICSTPGVTPPLLVFRPVAGERSEGAVELAMAPPSFGPDFAGGLFTSFFGMFSGGAANQENPVVFANPANGSRVHFIANQLLGHPNGLLATQNSLYLTDLDFIGNLGGANRGTIYQIRALVPAPSTVPAPLPLLGSGAALLWCRRLRRRLLPAAHPPSSPPERPTLQQRPRHHQHQAAAFQGCPVGQPPLRLLRQGLRG
jgi:hypothetical protein